MRYFVLYFSLLNLIPLLAARFFHQVNENSMLAAVFWSFIYCIPIFYAPLKRFWLILISSIVTILGIIELGHVFLFQGRITATTFFIIFDTNINETNDFLFDQLSVPLVFVLLIFIALSIFGAFKLYKSLPSLKFPKFKFFIPLGIVLPMVIFLIAGKFDLDKSLRPYEDSNTLIKIVSAKIRYDQELAKMEELQKDLHSNLKVKEKSPVKRKKITHVIIIGESTTRYKMGLYGYSRNTTPNLQALKDELIVLENSFCSFPPGTRENVKKILTFINTENQNSTPLNTHIIRFMKDLGYKTIWISNQVTSGRNNNTTAAIAKASDLSYFLNTSDNTSYDEKVIPLLNKGLQDSAEKKLIIIHLAGTHMKYRERYPSEFKFFNKIDNVRKSKFLNGKAIDYYNEYDNSILYNDFVMAKIFDLIKNDPFAKSAVYLSDHGEEVYDTQNFHGHPIENVTPHMFAIPVIFWLSRDKIDQKKLLSKQVQTKFVSDDLIHTLLDIYEIEHEYYDPKKSLLSGQFSPKELHKAAVLK